MKQFSEAALLVVGFGVIVIGVVLMFTHQSYEASFQNHLLDRFDKDYHWRSIGDTYTGLGAVAVGALMMAASAVLARRA
jgi:drug/metabolite transporter (DMT)-like permease